MKLFALVLSAVAACGGSQKPAAPPPTPDPIPQTAGPSCKDVTVHLATLADRDPTQDASANETLRQRCTSDKWSDDARSCLATAQSDDEVNGCKTKLTDAQRSAFPAPKAAADPWAAQKGDAAGAGAPGGAADQQQGVRRTRAPQKKAKTGGDPCEGGE
ncbi:MAG TPA: hypothetical protein VMJ10_02460 [Kofleriaceae bacterium]|nr:hypothetical protein [Kofleriaceae bacterium]